ncbi:MAG: cytochrome P450, partial [Actinomycetota bacterium]
LAHPQQFHKMMRDDMHVMAMDDGLIDATIVFRHEDVMEVLHDPETFSSNDDAVAIGQVRPLIPLQIDPPDHKTYRRLLDPLFAPKRVAELEGRTRQLVTELIDGVIDDGRTNFHHEIAEPLPTQIFLALLGLDPARFREFIVLKDGIIRPAATTVEEREAMVAETGQQIYAELDEVITARQAEPSDDFISGFLAAEVEGHRLTPDDVADICYLFFLAGLDTVTASLDCMFAYLGQHPDQRDRLVDDPELIPHAIEEMLRWETPVPGVIRITTTDTEVGGCPISAGTRITPLLGSANNDERVWEAADEVVFNREVNKHLAFGGGVHRCLGSHLARMELRVVLEEWHRRVPGYRLAIEPEELAYTP